MAGVTMLGTVLLVWAAVLVLLVAALAVGTRRRRPSDRDEAERRGALGDRRRDLPDRRMGLPDARTERVERRTGMRDRRGGVVDRRRGAGAPVGLMGHARWQ